MITYRPTHAMITILAIGIITTIAAHERFKQTTVKQFELTRYLGLWYEVARFDNRFERGLSCVTAYYSVMDNGRIEISNRGYNAEKKRWVSATGKGRIGSSVGQLQVSFFLFFYSDYNILALGESNPNAPSKKRYPYTWALVGSRTDKYLWILSRTKQLDEETFAHILKIAESKGYDVDKLIVAEPCFNY